MVGSAVRCPPRCAMRWCVDDNSNILNQLEQHKNACVKSKTRMRKPTTANESLQTMDCCEDGCGYRKMKAHAWYLILLVVATFQSCATRSVKEKHSDYMIREPGTSDVVLLRSRKLNSGEWKFYLTRDDTEIPSSYVVGGNPTTLEGLSKAICKMPSGKMLVWGTFVHGMTDPTPHLLNIVESIGKRHGITIRTMDTLRD